MLRGLGSRKKEPETGLPEGEERMEFGEGERDWRTRSEVVSMAHLSRLDVL